MTRELIRKLLPEELARAKALLGAEGWAAGRYEDAARLFEEITTSDDYVEFLTLPGYEWLTRSAARNRGSVARRTGHQAGFHGLRPAPRVWRRPTVTY